MTWMDAVSATLKRDVTTGAAAVLRGRADKMMHEAASLAFDFRTEMFILLMVENLKYKEE